VHSHTHIDKADNMVHPFACFKPCQVKDTTKMPISTVPDGEDQQASFVLFSSAVCVWSLVTAVHAPVRAFILSWFSRCLMAFMFFLRLFCRIFDLRVQAAAWLQPVGRFQHTMQRYSVLCSICYTIPSDVLALNVSVCVRLCRICELWHFIADLSQFMPGFDHKSKVF
jgi:hypothetical protein